MNRPDWDRCAAKLAAVYAWAMPESTRAAWYAELAGYDAQDVTAGLDFLVVNSERRPGISQIITATRAAKRRRLSEAPVNRAPGLPDGCMAVVWSDNYQPIAVLRERAKEGEYYGLPADIRITRVDGELPAGWESGEFATPPHHWAEPAEREIPAGDLAEQQSFATTPQEVAHA